MKNQFKFSAMALALVAVSFTSCEKDEADAIQDDQANVEVVIENNRVEVTDQAIIDQVRGMAIDIAAITKGDFHLPDGTVEQ